MERWQFIPRCVNKKTGMVRHAVLAWNLGDRICWIEPQYLDPFDSSHAMHFAAGTPKANGDKMTCGDWEFVSADEADDISNAQAEWYMKIGGEVQKEMRRLEEETPELADYFGISDTA